jgi:2-polyprenyl-6-methoxyphenol hydroxylase-like FAD-dependent oxidoreductase
MAKEARMTQAFDVLISGGGIAGLTLADRLHAQGHCPLLIERSPALRGEGYMIDFFGAGYAVAEKMGMLPQLEAIHYQIPSLRFLDETGGQHVSLNYTRLRKLLNGRHFNFMRGDLERVLYERIKDQVEVRFGCSIESFEQDEQQVHARLSDGVTISCDVLVGADGVHSSVRALAFGPEELFSRFLGYETAAFVLDDAESVALRDAFNTVTVPNRQVAVYPIRGGRLATFFLAATTSPGQDHSRAAALQALEGMFGDLDWVVPRLLAAAPQAPSIYFDDVSQIEMPTWNVGRVTLVGDACGCVSLIAGQGASLAMLGGYLLSGALTSECDAPTALKSYEHEMRPIVAAKQQAGRKFARWFLPDSAWHLWMRDLSLRLAGVPLCAPFIRRQFGFGAGVKL